MFVFQNGECSSLQSQLRDVTQRLEMSELYAQQMSSEDQAGSETMKTLTSLQQERDDLTSQVSQVWHEGC